MRIECPTCRAAYEVPDDKITGRKVRCASCGTDWAPLVPPPASVVAAPSIPAPAAMPFLAVPETAVQRHPITAVSKPTARRGLLVTAWVATLVLVAAVFAVAYVRREALMTAWPPSQRLYAWVGLR